MGLPFPFVMAYERMVRDMARHELPAGACWNLVDVFPDMDAPARARGAFGEYVNSGVLQVPVGLGWSNFGGSPAHLLVTADKGATKISSSGAVSAMGSVPAASPQYPISRMVSLNDKLVFAPRGAAAGGALQIFDGSSFVHAATNSPTSPLDVAVLGDFAVAVAGDKVYFSNPGDPTTWSPSTSYIQLQDDTIAIGALRGLLVVFCEGSIWRIRGTIPPGNGPSNMQVDPLAPAMQGILDARTVGYYASTLLFANDQGVWQTDGVSLKNLTEKFGIQQYWRDLIENQGAQAAVAWVHRGYYFITLFASAGQTTPLDTLVCDLDRGSWFRMSNMAFLGGAANSVISSKDDVALGYLHSDGSARIATISQVFETDSSGQDPNGVWISPVIETPYLRGFLRLHRKWIQSPGLQTWRNAYLNYDLKGGGQVDLTYTSNPETDSSGVATYSSLPDWGSSGLPSTSGRSRVRIPLQVTAQGLAFKIAVVPTAAEWTSFRLWEVEVEFYPRETSRV